MTYKIPKKEKKKEMKSYGVSLKEEKAIQKVEDELFEQNKPIKIENRDTLIVKTDKGEEKVTREEVAHYIKYETGSMSGLRQLGRIQGDWRPIDAIAEDCAWVFNEIDKELGK
jgi:hypothetical protein